MLRCAPFGLPIEARKQQFLSSFADFPDQDQNGHSIRSFVFPFLQTKSQHQLRGTRTDCAH